MPDLIPKPMKMIFVIVDRNMDKDVTNLLNENGINYHIAMPGKGTAPTDVQSFFGLGEKEKSVIMSVVEEDLVGGIFKKFNEELGFNKPNTGIAFSVKIGSLSNMLVLQYLTGTLKKMEEK